MSRCIACNNILTDEELKETRPDGQPEDMCRHCRDCKKSSYDEELDDDDYTGFGEEW